MKQRLFGFAFALMLVGCSGSGDDDFSPVACAAGKTQACVCDDANVGAQVCNKDGKAWGNCSCSGSDGTGGSGAAGNSAKECSADEDCTNPSAAFCVNGACVPPTIVPAHADCSGHAVLCEPPFECKPVPCDPPAAECMNGSRCF